VALEDMPAVIQAGLSALPEMSVRIKADHEAAVGLLIKVVDGVCSSGCTGFSIVTERP